MADVFISHQHEDRDRARLMAEILESLGFSVWWDLKMSAGEEFREALTAMLQDARVVIVLWSPRSVHSRFVRSEASRALQMGKLTPVLIEATELPLGLDEEHCADLTRWKGEIFDANFQALIRGLEERVGRPARLKTARPAMQRAQRDPDRAARAPWRGAATAARKRITPRWALAIVAILVVAGGAMALRRPTIETPQATASEPAAPRRENGELASARAPAARDRSTPPSQAELLAAVEALPSARRAAFVQAREAMQVREHAGAFGLAKLHPSVRRAVTGALRSAAVADASATRARISALRGEDAARDARTGAAGTIIEETRDRRWATEWANDAHNGFGVLSYVAGDRYAGAWRDGRFEGPGVFTYEGARARAAGLLRYEGDFAAGRRHGAGILLMRNGERYAGAFEGGALSGAGVYLYENGERYEGEWRANRREGVGALWSQDGELRAAGIWRGGELASRLETAG